MALPIVNYLFSGVDLSVGVVGRRKMHIATASGDLSFYSNFPGVAAAVLAFEFYNEAAITITSIQVGFKTKPTTAGTYTLAAAAAGNNLFSAATFDLTTTTSNSFSSITLTGTGANLTLAAGTTMTLTANSSSSDLVCATPELYITWTLA